MDVSRKRRIWFSVIALLLAFCLALIFAEIFLRLILPKAAAPEIELRMPDPALGYTLIPGAELGEGYASDANGYNNLTVPKEADIVALGDSFTWGENATTETTWPADLGKDLNLSAYDMGVGGYGPVQYYSLMDTALSFHPKYVVVGLLLSNDFFDAYNMVYNGHLLDESDYAYHGVPYVTDYWKELRAPSFSNDAAQTQTSFNHVKPPLFDTVRTWLHANSALYAFLSDRSYILREELGLSKPHWIGTTDWHQTDPDITLRWESTSTPAVGTIFWEGEQKQGVDTSSKNIIEGVRLTKELLLKMDAKAKAKGATLVVMIISDKEQAYAPLIGSKINDSQDFADNLTGLNDLRSQMLTFCEMNNLSCVDTLPYLTEALQKGEQLYPSSWDGHPIASGYHVLAQSAADYLKTQ